MSEQYNYEYYHCCCGPIAYEEPEHWVKFFGDVADRIVSDLSPKTVLDAGCAMGYLVAALRDRGVEAYGIDISRYAISKVREDIKPYCVVGSLTEELPESLPKKYDLVVTIEVLEHLYAEDGAKAIANMCGWTDRIIFSSTPDDYEERTHVNVQQREYWARLFAEQGFYDDLSYRPRYLTSYAACYQKKDNLLRQIEDYERNIRCSEAEHAKDRENWAAALRDKDRHIGNLDAVIESQRQAVLTQEEKYSRLEEKAAEQERHIGNLDAVIESQRQAALAQEEKYSRLEEKAAEQERSLFKQQKLLEETNTELGTYRLHYQAAINQRDELTRQLSQMTEMYNVISNAFCWKITKPVRVLLDAVKGLMRRCRATRLVYKGLKCLKENGWKYTWRKIKDKLKHRQDYAALNTRVLYTPQELEQQRSVKFEKDITFSILVPLYNTPEKFLREMIQSVLDQTYAGWELCLADGSDSSHGDVERICHQYAKADSRVRYEKLEKNLGISGNTNACIDMAQGDYLALFDHDDLLHPAALFEIMKAICEEGADFIYTDENTFHNSPKDAYCPHFKPDYAPDTLRANNYICHFTAFKRSLIDQVGVFRPECDGSQDYDMVLRLTEKAEKIVHIPKILYYWRAHANSVADSVGAKPYVIEAAHLALSEHLERVGLKGQVLDSVVPSMYRIKYELEAQPLVSILVPNYENMETLRTCLDSIFEKSTYPNFEVIVIENNSKSPELFEYYKLIQRRWENLRVITWDSYFNYSAINNFGAKFAKGEYLLLLNNDTEVISPDWIQEMLMYAQRSDVGAVGAKLYYPDDTVQHAGLGLGLLTLAGHLHRGFDRRHPGYMGRLIYAQDLSAVTFACVMIRRDVWDEVEGLDESFEVAFNDVDMCMRIRKAGYLIVWTPFAELYHYESKTRGTDEAPEKRRRFVGEVTRFQERWAKELKAGDPYYNPNFSLDSEDFAIRGG